MEYKTATHLYMPGHTVLAAIKLHNKNDVTISELEQLIAEYERLNGDAVHKAGESAKIPILPRHSN